MMNSSLMRYLLIFIALWGSHLFAQKPGVSEVIKFDSMIQDEPRIKFSKGVDEAVAPTTGALTAKVSALSLQGRGMPVEVAHHYNSSAIPTIFDGELGTGTLSKFAFINGLGGRNDDFYGGHFHTQFGLRDGSGLVTEGLVKDIIYVVLWIIFTILKNIIGDMLWIADLVAELMDLVNVDVRDNTNVHTYVAPMTPTVGAVKGIIGNNRLVFRLSDYIGNPFSGDSSFDILNNFSKLFDLILQVHSPQVIDQPNVVLSDGTTVGFKKNKEISSLAGLRTFSIKQKDQHGQYNLVAKKIDKREFTATQDFLYTFQKKDGIKYDIRGYRKYFIYIGSDFSLRDIFQTITASTSGGIPDITGIIKLFAQGVQIHYIPYGVVEKITDPSENVTRIEYEAANRGIDYNPRRIKKVIDSLGRTTQFNYNHDNFHDASMPLYDLKEIIKPDGSRVRYSYKKAANRVAPREIKITDSENRRTTFFFEDGGNDGRNKLIVGHGTPYGYLNKIQYPTGGYVTYDIRPIVDGNKYFFQDKNLTEKAVWKREEHTSVLPHKDTVETTTFDYDFVVNPAVIKTVSFNFNLTKFIKSIGEIVISGQKEKAIAGLVASIGGGLYLRNVNEVKDGKVTVTDASGKVSVHNFVKSNPGHFNHYIASFRVNGLLLFDYLTDFNQWQAGYRPTRMLHTSSTEAGLGVENVTINNTYNSDWLLTAKETIKGSLVQKERYEYDEYVNLTRKTGPLGSEERMYYELNASGGDYVDRPSAKFLPGLMTRKEVRNTNEDGREYFQTTHIEYDADGVYRGLPSKQILQKGRRSVEQVSTTKYNSFGEVVEQVDPKGTKTIFSYDYDSANGITKTTSVDIKTMDENGGEVSQTLTTSTKQDFYNEYLLEERDALGRLTKYANDSLGRVQEVVFADNTVLTYDYFDKEEHYIQDWIYVDVRDQEQIDRGGFLRYGYDGIGRLKYLEQHFKSGVKNVVYRSENFYNPDGTLEKVTDAQGRTTHLDYDTYRRLKTITYPDNTELHTDYRYYVTTNFYEQDLIDANDVETTYRFDLLGRLVSVKEPPTDDARDEGFEQYHYTFYQYDLLGNLLSFMDPDKSVTRYSYDRLNRLIKETYPDGSHFVYAYDRNNNITQKEDARGVKMTYTYDSINRLNQINVDGDFESRFTYDKLGNRLSARNNTVSAAFEYNERNWLTSETRTIQATPYTFEYFYNKTGDLLRTTYPSGYELLNKVDTLHRVTELQVKKPDASLVSAVKYHYNPMGTISKMAFGNGTAQDFSYDLRDRVKTLNIHGADADDPLLFTYYQYDAVGNRVQDNKFEDRGSLSQFMKRRNINGFEHLPQKTSYSYDRLYRLTGVHYPGTKPNKDFDHKYTYDAKGNRIEHDFDLGNHKFTYNKLNQLTELGININAGKHTYEYDKNGNLEKEERFASDSAKLVERNYTWDFDNRLTSIDIDPGKKANDNHKAARLNFAYDYDGNRVTKDVFHGETLDRHRTYVMGREEYTKTNTANPLNLENVYLGPLRIKSTGEIFWNQKDVLGSTVLITDEAGEKVERTDYDAFGTIEKQVKSKTSDLNDNRMTFTGKELDEETGLQYFGARYYDGFIGRWISRDLVPGFINKPYSLNRYTYVYNNPLAYNDPNGELPNFIIGAAIGGGLDLVTQGILMSTGAQKKFSWQSLAISTTSGAIGAGIATKATKLAKLTSSADKVVSKATPIVADASVNLAASLTSQKLDPNGDGEISAIDTAIDVTAGIIIGPNVGKGVSQNVDNMSLDVKHLKRKANAKHATPQQKAKRSRRLSAAKSRLTTETATKLSIQGGASKAASVQAKNIKDSATNGEQ